MKMLKERGFTLIELLIMTTIILVIITVLLIGLNSARIKSKDVAIITQINNALTSVELETGALGYYIGVCDLFNPGQPLEKVKDSIEKKGGIWVSCEESKNSYSLLVVLNSGQQAFSFINMVYALIGLEAVVEKEDSYNLGIHTSTEPVLFDKYAMRRLEKYASENNIKLSRPTYYCVGAKPPHIDGGNFISGYIFDVPRENFAGCGTPVSYTEAELDSAASFSGAYELSG